MRAGLRFAVLGSFLVVLTFLVIVYGYNFGIFDLGVVFGAFRSGLTYALLAAALVSVAAAGILAARKEILPAIAAFAVAISAGAFGYLPIWMKATAAKVPPIHDITTDVQDPPAFVAIAPLRADASNPAEYDPEQTEQQLAAYPDIKTFVMPKPLPEAYMIAMDAVKAEGLEIVELAPKEGRIEATATVPLFGFKDDVVIRMRNAHSVATVVDIRSKSRVGRSDLGFNARRIRSLMDRMEEAGGRLQQTAEGQEA